MLPLPDPEVLAVRVIQSELLAAVHWHPLPVDTAMVPVPPAVATFTEDGLSVKTQTAACVTLNVLVPTVMLAVREVVLVLASAE